MLKKHKGILLFLTAAIVFYFGLLLFMFFFKDKTGQPYIYNTQDYYFQKGGNTYRALNDFQGKKRYDVVVLGASHAYRGYDPRIFAKHGFRLYNLGTSNQSIINTYFLVASYFQTNKPELVLLDIYDESLLDNGLEFESSLNLIPNMREQDLQLYEMALALCDFRLINVCNLRLLNKTMAPIRLHEKDYVYNGYCQKADSVKGPIAMEKMPEHVLAVKLYFLKQVMGFFHNKGIKVVAVNYPNPWKEYNEQHGRVAQTIRSVLKEYNTPFWDYAYSLPLDAKNNYYDYTHLNQAGVNIYNERLLSDLKKMNLLK